MNNLLYSDIFWAAIAFASFALLVGAIVADIATDRPCKGTGCRCSHEPKPMARIVRAKNRRAL